jgi:hypothetical protein
MMSRLRERIFADVDYPDLKRRCLDVIKQLQIDADILINENFKAIQGAEEGWQKLEELDKKKVI